jgi:hypothetical protein
MTQLVILKKIGRGSLFYGCFLKIKVGLQSGALRGTILKNTSSLVRAMLLHIGDFGSGNCAFLLRVK